MTAEKKITYLIGAGASANAVPTVNTFSTSLERILYNIRDNKRNNNGPQFDEALSLIKEIQNHYTIDTLARKYWLIEDFEKYDKIKTLIALLILYHTVRDKIEGWNSLKDKPFRNLDHRYDSFFATFLQTKNKQYYLPPNIQFISWNYDVQFEKALSFYDNKEDILLGLQTFESQLIRLNGIGIFNNSIYHKFYSYYDINELELSDFFISTLNFEKKEKTRIQFAWEINDPKESYNKTAFQQMKNKIENARKRIGESDYVVVIGYSFPVFNREVDIEIFKGFNGERIFIQDIEGKANQIENQLEAIKTGLIKKCEIQTNVDQFFVPNQYWNDIELKKPGKIIAAQWI